MEFSSSQAALRIRRVQMLCAQHGLDGVLLVPGVDGRFSVCNQAVGYLFRGRSNRDTIDIVRLDDQLDDAVALITPAEVLLYAPNADLREQLQALLAPRVTSLRILGPTLTEAADPDLLEESKLAGFVHMLRGCRRLGIPCSLAPPEAHANRPGSNGGPSPRLSPAVVLPQQLGPHQLLALEKWPLLQAYGLEWVGRSGFFTMNFKVFDVQSHMQCLYGELDGRSLEVLVSEAVPILRQHWDEVLQALGGKPPAQRSGLSEKQVVEPLAGYFAYGLLRAAPGVEPAVTLPPRVVFGPRSSDDSARSEALPLAQCGAQCGALPPQPPLHWVVEAADPRSPLRVARTYFLARGATARDVFADPDEDVEQSFSWEAVTGGYWEGAGPGGELVGLMRLYTALVDAGRAAMSHFATVEGATGLSAKAEAVEVLGRRAEQLGVAGWATGGGGASALSGRLRFSLVQMDHSNRVTAPAVRGSRQLKILRLSLPDITPRSHSGAAKVLGGLVYGDTFLELPPASHAPPGAAGPGRAGFGGGDSGSGWRLLVLTEGVPPLVAIPAAGCEAVLAARALRSLSRVVEGSSGAQSSQRAALLASQRHLERRTAAAVAESQALAARLRARRLGGSPIAAGEEEDVEEVELQGDYQAAEEEATEAEAEARAAAAAASAPRPAEALGRLLTLGGGDEAVLLTGAPSCPALSGTLYCFSAGLVFLESVSRATWVLDLRGGPAGTGPGEAAGAGALEAVTFQQLLAAEQPRPQRPESAAPGSGAVARAGAGGAGLGEAVVFRGSSPACGLPPACHLTTNPHVALPLETLSPAARRFLIQSVLPAWNQTCREAASAAPAASPASYLRDMTAPSPFPPSLFRSHVYAVQSSSTGGAVKRWPALMAEDSEVQAAVEGLDAEELRGPLSSRDPLVETLLLQPPPPPSGAGRSTSGGSVTLVVGLPGADQVAVAAAVTAMFGEDAGARVALLPPDSGPLCAEHFEAALAAAVAEPQQQQPHLTLATSSYSGLSEQLRMLAAAAVGGAAGRWRLAAVVVCVSSDVAYEEPGRGALAGGLLAQLLPGCVDCVVLGGSEPAQVSALSQLVAQRLPEVPVVRAGRTALMRARQELLPLPAERAARLAAQQAAVDRDAWGPLTGAEAAGGAGRGRGGDSAGASCAGGLLGLLRASRVAFEGALTVARLGDALAGLGLPTDPARAPPLPLSDTDSVAGPLGSSAASAAPPHGSGPGALVAVIGCVRLLPGGRLSELVGSRQAALRSREWSLVEAAVVMGAPRLPPDGHSPGGELLFVGSGPAVEPEQLRALLASCGADPASASTAQARGPGAREGAAAAASAAGPFPASAAQLSAAQRAALRQTHLWDPLPEGYCFNGTQYFDAFGDASLEHPHMDRFIAEWIAEQQAQAARARQEAESGAGGLAVVHVSGPSRL